MKRSTTPSFVLNLKLRYTPQQRNQLDKIFRCAGYLYNNLVADRKPIAKRIVASDEWKQVGENISTFWQRIREASDDKNTPKTKDDLTEEQKEELKVIYKPGYEILKKYGMGDVAFQLKIKRWSKHYDPENKKKKKDTDSETSIDTSDNTPKSKPKSKRQQKKRRKVLIGSTVVQNIASQVWRKFDAFFFGDGKELCFMPWQDFQSLEGKPNTKEQELIKLRGKLALTSDSEEARKIAEKIASKEVNSPDGNNFSFYRSTKELSVNGMRIPVLIPDKPYETEALKNRIKYCRIVRIPWKNCWLYKLQLVMEGLPPFKTEIKRIKRGRNEIIIVDDSRHPLGKGKGRVGLDIGTQTLAHVSEYSLAHTTDKRDKSIDSEQKKKFGDGIGLNELADKANNPERKLARINRALDQSRRATNPEFFDKDNKTVIRRDQLKPELLDKHNKRKWKNSAHYWELAQLRRYYYAKAARTRRCQHQEMANYLMQLGDTFYIENMRFSVLAKKAKKEEKQTANTEQVQVEQTTFQQITSQTSENTATSKDTAKGKSKAKSVVRSKGKGKSKNAKKSKRNKSRKRFGKSIGNKAPATFVSILQKKVKERGGDFIKINTSKARASQYNHVTKQYIRQKGHKGLKKRWKDMPDGRDVQRDLYSAFLIMNTNETYDGFIQERCESTFESFILSHDKEFKRLMDLKPDKKQKKHKLPASMGFAEVKTRLADRLARLAS